MKQYFFHSFTSFEIIGQHKSGPVASVGQRGGGGVEVYPFHPLTLLRLSPLIDRSSLAESLKVLIVLFSQAAKYNCKRFKPRSHFKSSLMSLHNQ